MQSQSIMGNPFSCLAANFQLFYDLDLFYNDGNLRNIVVPAAAAGLHVCDLIYNVNSLNYLAESRILTVKVGRIAVHDEELRGCGVRSHGSCH